LKKWFYVLFEPWVKKCDSDEERKLRAGKGAYNIFKLIYFTGATYWGWAILNKQPWFPKSLGGNGDYALMWENYPYQKHCDQLGAY
jgi:hypothetical protein